MTILPLGILFLLLQLGGLCIETDQNGTLGRVVSCSSLKPIRVRQALPSDLDFTLRGCLWRGPQDTPEWCGPPAQAQSEDVLRSYREHLRREIRMRSHSLHWTLGDLRE